MVPGQPVRPAFASVSSQVSQVPQGVTPPAQLFTVPDTLTYSRTRSPAADSSMLVVPPPAAGVVGQAVADRDPEGLVAADLVVVDQGGRR